MLAGGESASLGQLTESRPKSLLPVVNRPLIEWQLEALGRNGIEEVGIALSPDHVDAVSRRLDGFAPAGMRLHFAVDEVPRGPAGGIKLFERLLGGRTFVVVDGGTFLGDVSFDDLVRAHCSRGAKATLGVLPETGEHPSARAVVAPDGTIQGIFDRHPSSERRRSRALAGVSVFDPAVLELIPGDGYADIKDRLVASLQERGALVVAETTQEHCVPIDSVQRYYQLHAGLVEGDFVAGNGYRQIADGVWIEEGTELAPSVFVLGPVLIGRDCRIEDDAHLVGPVIVGDGSRIGASSIVRGSILWEGSELSPGCKVENSIVASGGYLSKESWLRGSIVVAAGPRPEKDGRVMPHRPTPLSISPANGPSRAATIGKTIIDRVGSAALLTLLGPLFLLCAAAIRLDSPGPVFFRQRRCGRGGREFSMFKFRTMFEDADARQAELRAKNDADGPMFKMLADPRITRLGRILRRTSIDELPQLLNVLRGEMSLVGPRPLAAKEMLYCPAWRDRRLTVKPGMTGLWQVSGRSQGRFHDWIKYDIDYVKRQSLGLDLRILAKTVTAVVRRSGAV